MTRFTPEQLHKAAAFGGAHAPWRTVKFRMAPNLIALIDREACARLETQTAHCPILRHDDDSDLVVLPDGRAKWITQAR